MRLESNKVRIAHMLDACRQALSFAEGRTFPDLQQDLPVQHLLIRNLEIIGEAASRLSTDLRNAHGEIPWGKIIGMRNYLIHAYFDVDIELVWRTVTEAVPELVTQLESISRQLNTQ